FCDDYVELVKNRAYGSLGEDRAVPARAALRVALSVLLRLFAPVLPFVTEEVWSWWHDEQSVHRAPWPGQSELEGGAEPALWEAARKVLGEVRRKKTEASVSLRAPVALVRITAPEPDLDRLRAAADDLIQAGNISDLRLMAAEPGEDAGVAAELA
ncbi:MAG: class I tRNA ligase family protein, partial [Acidimicrobiales bacterium]